MFRRFLYRSYRRIYGIHYTLRRRLTRAGRLVLVLFAVAWLLGLDTNLATGYQALAFLIALLVASTLWSLVSSARLARTSDGLIVRRDAPRFGTAGQPLQYRLAIKNATAKRQSGITVLEDLEDPRPTIGQFTAKTRRIEAGFQGFLDHLIGFSRWHLLMSQRQPATIPQIAVPDLLPNEQIDVRINCLPVARGRLHFTGTTLARPDVFGLMRSQVRHDLPQSLLILPKRYRLPRIVLPGIQQYQQGGVEQASAVGQSHEFISLRDYRPGDPQRQIHWRSVAKTDRLIVREYEDEFFVRHALILDTFASPGQEVAFEEAVSVAASFVYSIHTQESLLDLLLVGTEAYCFTAGRGLGHVDRLLEVLAGVTVSETESFSTLECLVAGHAPLVSGCVCVFLGWDEPRQRVVQRLQALRVPTLVCVVTEADELETLPATSSNARPGAVVHHLHVGKIQEGLLAL